LHFRGVLIISGISAVQFENAAIIIDCVNWKPWFDSRVPSKRIESDGQWFRPDEIDTRKILSGWREPVTRPPVYQLRHVNKKHEQFLAALDLCDCLQDDGSYLDPRTGKPITSPSQIAKSFLETGITWATRSLVMHAQRLRRERG